MLKFTLSNKSSIPALVSVNTKAFLRHFGGKSRIVDKNICKDITVFYNLVQRRVSFVFFPQKAVILKSAYKQLWVNK